MNQNRTKTFTIGEGVRITINLKTDNKGRAKFTAQGMIHENGYLVSCGQNLEEIESLFR